MKAEIVDHVDVRLPRGALLAPSSSAGNELVRRDADGGNLTKPLLAPVLRLAEMSPQLYKLYRELDYATPKVITFVGVSSESELVRELLQTFHFVEWYKDERRVLICLDPHDTNEELVAHELMHPWLHYYEGYEDYRLPRGDLPPELQFLVISVQSMIIDQRITERLQERGGLNTHYFAADMAEMLHENHLAFQAGFLPRSQLETLALGHCLAPILFSSHNFDFTARERAKVESFISSCQRCCPDVIGVAETLADEIARCGYRTTHELRSAVDACLEVSFRYLGLEFEASKYLVRVTENIAFFGKPVGMLDDIPSQIKHKILREWVAREKDGAHMRVKHDPTNRQVSVQFLAAQKLQVYEEEEMRAFYHAALGRFLARDRSRKGDVNAYVGFKNSPLAHVDPDGNEAVPDWITDDEKRKWERLTAEERKKLGDIADSLPKYVIYSDVLKHLEPFKDIPGISLADLGKVKSLISKATFVFKVKDPKTPATATTKGTTVTLHGRAGAGTLLHELRQLINEAENVGYERGQALVYYMDNVASEGIGKVKSVLRGLSATPCDPDAVKRRWGALLQAAQRMRTQRFEVPKFFGGRKPVTYTINDNDIKFLKEKMGFEFDLQKTWDSLKDKCCRTASGNIKKLGDVVPRPKAAF